MEDESSAVAMVNYFTNCAATLRERSVYVQFSNHRELKTDQVTRNDSEGNLMEKVCLTHIFVVFRLTRMPLPRPRPPFKLLRLSLAVRPTEDSMRVS